MRTYTSEQLIRTSQELNSVSVSVASCESDTQGQKRVRVGPSVRQFHTATRENSNCNQNIRGFQARTRLHNVRAIRVNRLKPAIRKF